MAEQGLQVCAEKARNWSHDSGGSGGGSHEHHSRQYGMARSGTVQALRVGSSVRLGSSVWSAGGSDCDDDVLDEDLMSDGAQTECLTLIFPRPGYPAFAFPDLVFLVLITLNPAFSE